MVLAAPSAGPAEAGGTRVRAHFNGGRPPPSTLDDVVALLRTCTRVLVVTGAGVSVSCGIPDFRSPTTGLYDALARSGHPALAAIGEPQALFDLEVFKAEPEVFYSLAHLLYDVTPAAAAAACGSGKGTAPAHTTSQPPPPPEARAPSLAHRFVAALEARGVLLRNATQNVDGLEAAAGVTRVLTCHGTLATATCRRCGARVPAAALLPAIAAGTVARCTVPSCAGKPSAVMKPDVVFFREALPPGVGPGLAADAAAADLLLVIGSSMRVAPVADVPRILAPGTPAVLINAEPLGGSGSGGVAAGALTFDVELLGDADVVCRYLWRRLGWPGLPAFPSGGSDGGGGGGAVGVKTDDGAAAAAPRAAADADAACSSPVAESAADPAHSDDTIVSEERPGRFRFSSASQDAAQADRRAAMAARMHAALQVAGGGGASGARAAPVATRSGRTVKRPRAAES